MLCREPLSQYGPWDTWHAVNAQCMGSVRSLCLQTSLQYSPQWGRCTIPHAPLKALCNCCRMLAIAYRDIFMPFQSNAEGQQWGGEEYAQDRVEKDLTLIAVVGIMDPLRPQVPASIQQCHRAGITVRMLTGQSPNTSATHTAGIHRARRCSSCQLHSVPYSCHSMKVSTSCCCKKVSTPAVIMPFTALQQVSITWAASSVANSYTILFQLTLTSILQLHTCLSPSAQPAIVQG